MAKVLIEIDVLNPKEVIQEKKGKFTTWFASLIYSEENLKRKVEEKICAEIVKSLRENLDKGFEEQGVAAKIKISATL